MIKRAPLLAIGAVVAVCLLMVGALYGVWLYTDEGKDFVKMRLLTVGMLLFNQAVMMALLVWVIFQQRRSIAKL